VAAISASSPLRYPEGRDGCPAAASRATFLEGTDGAPRTRAQAADPLPFRGKQHGSGSDDAREVGRCFGLARDPGNASRSAGELTCIKGRTSAQWRMPLFQAERCRSLAAECRQLALAAESKLEKTFLTNLAFSWNRLANQTDRYVEFLKKPRNEKEN
jgi:hypothetical protein